MDTLTVTLVSTSDSEEVTARFSSTDSAVPDRIAVLDSAEIELLTAAWRSVAARDAAQLVA